MIRILNTDESAAHQTESRTQYADSRTVDNGYYWFPILLVNLQKQVK